MKKFYVGIKSCILKDNKILLLEKSGGNFWEVPGGRIDNDETIEETLRRELREEVPNIKNISIGRILGAHRLSKDIDEGISLTLIYYKVTADFEGDPQISDEHSAWKWATEEEARQLMVEKADLIGEAFKQ